MLSIRSLAGLVQIVLATLAATDVWATAEPVPEFLDDYSIDQVGAWLEDQNLNAAFADRFRALQYDGDMLANFLQPGEVLLADFPGATAGHVAKLFSRIRKYSRPDDQPAEKYGQEQQQQQAEVSLPVDAAAIGRRSLENDETGKAESASEYTGIRIKHNRSVITMGTTGDVSIMRGGEDQLATEDALLVKGLDVARAAQGLSAGGVGWDFTHPASRHYLRSAPDFVLPPHFTIECWVKPYDNDAGNYFLSWATDEDQNCLLLTAGGFKTTNDWHHLVVTYDRHAVEVYDNGVNNPDLLWGQGEFCGGYTGSLVFGQEQDTVGGGFVWSQGTAMVLDTVAIYNYDFSKAEQATTGKTCVDMTDPGLVTVWTGYTRGADQVGINQAEVYFDGFLPGASGDDSCSVEGNGVGVLGDSYAEYADTHVSPAVGAVGWVFPGQDTNYHFLVQNFTLPLDFTIEAWVYPLNNTADTYFLSWAVEGNDNCFLLKGSGFTELRQWYHVVVTWDGVQALVYLNGELAESLLWGQFCDSYFGSLSIGQEQDSVGGNYVASQAASIILDTVAVYHSAWSPEKVQQVESSPCVDLGDEELYALYTGYSRGKDLIGAQDGEVFAAEILSPGQPSTSGDAYQWLSGDIVFEVDACQAAQDQVDATPPSFDSPLVGGVGWDFTGASTAYYFVTGGGFQLPPSDFTIEFWMYPRQTKGYVLSFATEFTDNCLLLQNNNIFSLYNWHHVVVVTEQNGGYGFTTTVYINGTKRSDFLHSNYCGNRTGSLAIAQEQDSVGGSFVVSQATDAIIDTLAIYNTAWTEEEIGIDQGVGVDLQRADLYALYSGYTKGKDLVGGQDAEVWLYQFANGMPNNDASVATLDMLSPSTVGGVAWDFPQGTNEYYFATKNNFRLPTTGFALEMWLKIKVLNTVGHFISWATPENDNCLVTQMSGFTDDDVGTWHHFVITYDPETDTTYPYLDGVINNDLVHSSFCGSYTGALMLTQDQDTVGGGFEDGGDAEILIDTFAVYSSYWDADQVNERAGQCVNLHDTSLVSLYSGYTRGKDLVGSNDAKMFVYGWEEGADLDCSD